VNPAAATLPPHVVEALAEAIHENYRAQSRLAGSTPDIAQAPWAELPEHLRDSNRSQAADIPEKLRAIGYEVTAADPSVQRLRLSAAEIEELARLEHDRWVKERCAAGWSLGPVRDVDNKVTPYLVAWDLLPEDVREKDRHPVRDIPRLLKQVGLDAVRCAKPFDSA
jgi:hypothetical protein